ncbi:MAG: acyloxyacyl hydrolase [Gammaproteobacteria bacterium]|nr:acyloxyacyl hydrolase [Gammaproteobacteria bacterium]MBU1624236.1 acyloxyacyl hydrolase [Gammaproteobacteria bacterium]MBU1981964.1 acyloxyacyl hydrolase [Gammaproteobacteria bacterium]
MAIRQPNIRLVISVWLAMAIAMLCLVSPRHSHALDMELQSVGMRLQIGEKSHVIGALQPESFHESDIVANFSLPWAHQFQSGWQASTRLLTHAGVLRGQNDTALVAVAIPALAFGNGSFMIDTGLGLAWLSKHRFALQDFGGPLQFALTLGVEVPLYRHIAAGYRFMHYSDAGFYAPGTIGTDMHMVELLYRF